MAVQATDTSEPGASSPSLRMKLRFRRNQIEKFCPDMRKGMSPVDREISDVCVFRVVKKEIGQTVLPLAYPMGGAELFFGVCAWGHTLFMLHSLCQFKKSFVV